jgi:hypothetical protein
MDARLQRARLASSLKHWHIVLEDTGYLLSGNAKRTPAKHLVDAYLLRADAFVGLKAIEKAKAEYAQTLAAFPDARMAHVSALKFYQSIGDTRDAELERKAIAQLDKDFVPIK